MGSLTPATERARGERGWLGLVLRLAVYFTVGMIAELVLAAWWDHVAGALPNE